MQKNRKVKKMEAKDLVVGELYMIRSRKDLNFIVRYDNKIQRCNAVFYKPLLYLKQTHINPKGITPAANYMLDFYFLCEGKEMVIPWHDIKWLKKARRHK